MERIITYSQGVRPWLEFSTSQPRVITSGLMELRSCKPEYGPLVIMRPGMGITRPDHKFMQEHCTMWVTWDFQCHEMKEMSEIRQAFQAAAACYANWLFVRVGTDGPDRIEAVIEELTRDATGVRISVTDLAKICWFSRTWTSQMVSQLIEEGDLIRDEGVLRLPKKKAPVGIRGSRHVTHEGRCEHYM